MKLIPTQREGVSNIAPHSCCCKSQKSHFGRYFSGTIPVVDIGAIDSVAPASELTKIGIKAIGREPYELADGTIIIFEYGLAEITVISKTTAGRVIFGPEGVEPILGVTALESVEMVVDPGMILKIFTGNLSKVGRKTLSPGVNKPSTSTFIGWRRRRTPCRQL